MGKPKGAFRPGKYVPTLSAHFKAKRDKAGAHLDVTIRLTKANAQNLRRQIDAFLDELNKQGT